MRALALQRGWARCTVTHEITASPPPIKPPPPESLSAALLAAARLAAAGGRTTGAGAARDLAARHAGASLRFRLAARAARFALAPIARLARFGHGDGDRLAAALHLAAPPAAALELAVLELVHHLFHFTLLSRAGHLEPPCQ